MLDYGQRLITHHRDTFAKTHGDSGKFAIDMATIAGRKAMNNFNTEYFKIGESLNASIIDSNSPLLSLTSLDKLTSSILYTADSTQNSETIVRGNRIKADSKSDSYLKIKENFLITLRDLGNR